MSIDYFQAAPLNEVPNGIWETPERFLTAPPINKINNKVEIFFHGASIMKGVAKEVITQNKNTKLHFTNGCIQAKVIEDWTANNGNNTIWSSSLKLLGSVPAANVQVVICQHDKQSYPMPLNQQVVIDLFKAEFNKLIPIYKTKFPNLKHIYFVARPYSDFARENIKYKNYFEPSAYWNELAIKASIEQYTGPIWISDGCYPWTNGEVKRLDGFQLLMDDFQELNIHLTKIGYGKIATFVLDYVNKFSYSK